MLPNSRWHTTPSTSGLTGTGKDIAQCVLVLAAILGAGSLAGERAQGSAELILTRPLSR
ncbi:MAG: hypothetical protein AB1445_05065 [Bacillota bacterium]